MSRRRNEETRKAEERMDRLRWWGLLAGLVVLVCSGLMADRCTKNSDDLSHTAETSRPYEEPASTHVFHQDPSTIDPKEREYAKAQRDGWLSALKTVADRTKDEKALAIYDVLHAHLYAGRITKGGFQLLEDPHGDPKWMMFVVVTEKDEHATNRLEIATLAKGGIAGVFLLPVRTLAVRPIEEYNEVNAGTILAHEGNHAYEEMANGVKPGSEAYAEEEYETYLVQGRIRAKLGGESYQALLRDGVDELNKARQHPGPNGKLELDIRTLGPRMEKIFGSIRSESDRAWMITDLARDIQWKDIDDTHPDQDEQHAMKVAGLLETYQERGFVQ